MIDCDKETLILSDDKIFYTIEGEGEYVGQRSLFMRMAMCNLTCIGFASEDSPHGCDSFVSWSVKNKMTFNEIFQMMEDNNWIDKLKKGTIWKLTGGEPLIQQKQLLKLVEAFAYEYDFVPKIDFETNATLMPDEKWYNIYKATFTTSPKLTTNGDPESKTYKPDVLRYHREIGSGFKFVINDPAADIEEIWRKYVDDEEDINISRDRIWFMPVAGSRKEHLENAEAVVEYAKSMHVHFSPRLHLLVWDMALKV
ncbi:7-carboxy-7-deazaguanine synthase QueE [bacterium]|nr:7-carboxy-7-deazaguanine synthase QueE [bacterium]